MSACTQTATHLSLRTIVSLIFLTITTLNTTLFAQKLTISDLTSLCEKKTWEEVNQSLLKKGWIYHDSEKGSSTEYNTITWSFEKNPYNNKAKGWFHLFTYEGLPNKIVYDVANKASYDVINGGLSAAGFKSTDGEIEDGMVTSWYANNSYKIAINTLKLEEDDDYWESTRTSYNFLLIKKSGVYDPDNGKKTLYYDDGTIWMEYTLKNGDFEGISKTYHENGQLFKEGLYRNDKGNGPFKEYDEYGNLRAEYAKVGDSIHGPYKLFHENGKPHVIGTFVNGQKHGKFQEFDEYGQLKEEYTLVNGLEEGIYKVYENGKISVLLNFKNGKAEGPKEAYYYDDESGVFLGKVVTPFVSGTRHGKQETFIRKDSMDLLIAYDHYQHDILNGPFMHAGHDSVTIGSYLDGELHGKYRRYLDLKSYLFGLTPNTDTTQLILMAAGTFQNGNRNGYWSNFHASGNLSSEGNYRDGLQHGEWKYYFAVYKENDIPLPYSGKLFLIENYAYGKLNGKSTRYASLEDVEVPCPDKGPGTSTKPCTTEVYTKYLEIAHYKDEVLHGPYELRDSNNILVRKGEYVNGEKTGTWTRRIKRSEDWAEDFNPYEKGYLRNGIKEGKWVDFLTDESRPLLTSHYTNGNLNGETAHYDDAGRIKSRRQFSNNTTKEVIVYNPANSTFYRKYEITEDASQHFICKRTVYNPQTIETQIYWIKKSFDFADYFWNLEDYIEKKIESRSYTVARRSGDYTLTDQAGRTLASGAYQGDDSTGAWTMYDYNQSIRISATYASGRRISESYYTLNGPPFSGEFVFANPNTGLTEHIKIKEGLRNGKTEYVDPRTDKVVNKQTYKEGILKE